MMDRANRLRLLQKMCKTVISSSMNGSESTYLRANCVQEN